MAETLRKQDLLEIVREQAQQFKCLKIARSRLKMLV